MSDEGREPQRLDDAALDCLAEQPVLGASLAVERLRWLERRVQNASPIPTINEMWSQLARYQPVADEDGHGESWRRMCVEKTKAAAMCASFDAALKDDGPIQRDRTMEAIEASSEAAHAAEQYEPDGLSLFDGFDPAGLAATSIYMAVARIRRAMGIAETKRKESA